MRVGPLIGVNEDGLDVELTRPVNIPVHVVAHADDLGRNELHSVQGLSEKPCIWFPESVVRGDDDRLEIAVQSYGLHLGQSPTGLSVGNNSHAVGGAQLVQHPLHVGVELETFPRECSVEVDEDRGQLFTYGGNFYAFPSEEAVPDGLHVYLRIFLASLFFLLFHDLVITIPHLPPVQVYAVIGKIMRNSAVDLFERLIGLDIDSGSIEIKEDVFYCHDVLP